MGLLYRICKYDRTSWINSYMCKYLFWFLPSLVSLDNLKKVSNLGLKVQGILILMPIYHAAFNYFPIDPGFFVMVFVLAFVMILFFRTSRQNERTD